MRAFLDRLGRAYCYLLIALTMLCFINAGLWLLAAGVGLPLP